MTSLNGFLAPSISAFLSVTKLDIRGHFMSHERQPVGVPGGCPQWVADVFAADPKIKKIAVSGDDFGVVYYRSL